MISLTRNVHIYIAILAEITLIYISLTKEFAGVIISLSNDIIVYVHSYDDTSDCKCGQKTHMFIHKSTELA